MSSEDVSTVWKKSWQISMPGLIAIGSKCLALPGIDRPTPQDDPAEVARGAEVGHSAGVDGHDGGLGQIRALSRVQVVGGPELELPSGVHHDRGAASSPVPCW